MPESAQPKIIVLAGPTGIGKTVLSIEMAERFNGAIVGADSMQVYQYMDIGTAKPDAGEQAQAPHYMIDVATPDQPFDAAAYARMARAAVYRILDQGRLPFVVGGTGFYIKALLHGLFPAKPADAAVRGRLHQEAVEKGIHHLYDRLRQADPPAAERIHPNDTYRIIRALEVYDITGRPMSDYQAAHGFSEQPFKALKFCLYMDREALYERINRRVETMVAAGLLEEVKRLLARGYSADLKPMQSLGYRHMLDYLSGRLDWATAVDQLKKDTRRYAKRQLTWFRNDPEMIWKQPSEKKSIFERVAHFIHSNKQ